MLQSCGGGTESLLVQCWPFFFLDKVTLGQTFFLVLHFSSVHIILPMLHARLQPRTYVVGSKCFRPDIQKPRRMENAVRDILCHLW